MADWEYHIVGSQRAAMIVQIRGHYPSMTLHRPFRHCTILTRLIFHIQATEVNGCKWLHA